MLGLGNNLVTGPVQSTFSPLDLPGLMVWLKFDTGLEESDTTTPEDGEVVTKWGDSSYNGNNAVSTASHFTYNESKGGIESADSTQSKINLKSQLNFDGEFAVYMRLEFSTITSSGSTDLVFYDSNTSTADFLRIQTSTEIRSKISGATAHRWAVEGLETGVFYNIGFERDTDDDLFVFVNNDNATPSTAINNPNGWDLDAIGGGFDGVIKEVIICESKLNSKQRTNVQTWLANLTQGE